MNDPIFSEKNFDILIVGAGLIGSSVAMNLAKFSEKYGAACISVIDIDLQGGMSSSELNAGGVRATWNQPINILASIDSIRYFEERADDLGYRPCGYLWLKTAEQFEQNKQAYLRQKNFGWDVQEWGVSDIAKRMPFIDKHHDLYGAYFGVKDGLINSNLLKLHYRNEAIQRGVKFFDHTSISSAKFNGTSKKWEVTLECFEKNIFEKFLLQEHSPSLGKKHSLSTQILINCAGPWAAAVAGRMGYSLPSISMRRQISLFDMKDLDLSPYGMVIDTSGVYFHPEATFGLAGFCNRDEPEGINFDYEGEAFFQNHLWPALYERSTKFENLKHVTGWAGLYETSPDESAILGEVLDLPFDTSGQCKRTVFEAHSFSGHGVMHSYAAGRAIAELIFQEKYESINFEPLNGKRFKTGELIHEGAVI